MKGSPKNCTYKIVERNGNKKIICKLSQRSDVNDYSYIFITNISIHSFFSVQFEKCQNCMLFYWKSNSKQRKNFIFLGWPLEFVGYWINFSFIQFTSLNSRTSHHLWYWISTHSPIQNPIWLHTHTHIHNSKNVTGKEDLQKDGMIFTYFKGKIPFEMMTIKTKRMLAFVFCQLWPTFSKETKKLSSSSSSSLILQVITSWLWQPKMLPMPRLTSIGRRML